MRAMILTLLLAFCASTVLAKGGCSASPAECKTREDQRLAEDQVKFEQQKSEEDQEAKEVRAARQRPAGPEQVRIFRIDKNGLRYGDPDNGRYSYSLGYSDMYFESQKHINAWLRQNSAKITRVSQSGDLVLIFYR